uniref:Uncharacterized protein n=1 Tax=Ananas comosus var. bracteatus TaxID=296719 RepID=A0A6V7P4E7_ANACO|nr:unnamed protein product [Ananas comosus var. bracteatus]
MKLAGSDRWRTPTTSRSGGRRGPCHRLLPRAPPHGLTRRDREALAPRRACCGAPSHGHALGVVATAAHPSGSLARRLLDSSIRVFDVDSNASVASLDAPPPPPPPPFRGLGLQFDPR